VGAEQSPASDSFGTLLRRYRLALGLSQEELADRSGLSVRAIANMERGRTTRPRRHSVRSLAEALGLPEPQRLQLDRAAHVTGGDLAADLAPPLQIPPRQVPHQLPATVADFIGRAAEVKALSQILHDVSAGQPGTVVISAIGGTAGVGKTALALHWAHQVADWFGDGQLWVNLRGFDPSGAPATAAEAIRGFLDALGVPPERIPASPDAQAGLYRSLLSDQQMLIVLDNARDEQQVRPLLPASPGSLVIVTSRSQLSGLAAANGARLLALDVLTHGEAVQLLTARLGASRAAAEPGAISGIAGLCACLPLALAVTAARAATRPGFPLAALAAELRDSADRLDALDAGDAVASVRAVFSWSYRQLSDESARMFRLLGLHPGPDVTVPAAASLAAADEPGARRMLGELTRDCLIGEHVPGRYAFHDLLRAYAISEAHAHDSEAERVAATGRILDHYLHTAQRADQLLKRVHQQVTPLPAQPGVVPEELAGYEHAMAWFQAEHRLLPILVGQAARAGLDTHAWQLAELLTTFYDRRGYWGSLLAVQEMALAASERLADQQKQAVFHHRLGQSSNRLGYGEAARAHFEKALDLYRVVGDPIGQGRVHISLGARAERQGRHREALEHCLQALDLFRAAGERGWQATVINNIGWCHAALGEYEQAQACARQAISLHQELGKRESEACAWDSLGYAHTQLGQHSDAFACYQRALAMFRELGDRFNEADVLAHLGDYHRDTGDPSAAIQHWRRALAILDELHHPNAANVRAKLAPHTTNGHRRQRS
jgi:tetratricopeptide (TPR) repeat protein/transcriptional regulator with XRE-family HTH domain